MFELLFNGNKTIELLSGIAIIVVIGLILVAFLKSKNAKFFVGVLLFIVLLFSGIFSGIQINTYYNAEGGIYGALTGVFNPNQVNVVDSIEYSFDNVELTQSHDDVYTAKILIKDVLNFDGTKNYGVFINNAPCDSVEYSTVGDYLIANYSYVFLDDSKEEILTDTLKFQFAFYTNSTSLTISTNGGANAVKYWNYYFNKNVFVLNIRETDYWTNQNFDFGSGDVGVEDDLLHKSFSDCSWEEINTICDLGLAQFVFKVGDEKTFSLNTGEEITVVILGFNHDDLISGGKAGISLGMKNLLSKQYSINSTNTNVGGWDKCEIRSTLNNEIFSQLPADLQKVIKFVNKKTSAGDRSADIVISSDKLWILSIAEIYSKTAIENTTFTGLKRQAFVAIKEGEQYDYYKNLIADKDPFDALDETLKQLSNGAGSPCKYCLRSPSYYASNNFALAGSEGGRVGYDVAGRDYGISFCFCI